MIATSTTFPIILAEIGFVGIVAGIATAVIICIVMSLDKKRRRRQDIRA